MGISFSKFFEFSSKIHRQPDLEKGKYMAIDTEKSFININNMHIIKEHHVTIEGDVHLYGTVQNDGQFTCMNFYTMDDQSNIHFKNHLEIEQSSDSRCSKYFQHYFDVVTNMGKWYIYNDDILELLDNTEFLEKTPDEILCFNILNDIITQSLNDRADKSVKLVTIHDVIDGCQEWEYKHPEAHRRMVHTGLNYDPVWPPEVMLGQLWLIYISKIVE